MPFNGMLSESINILMENEYNTRTYGHEYENIQTVLEDANSPVTKKYQQKLFQSVIDKKHINFGSIPKSEGNIKNYEGYPNMVETLNILYNLAADQKNSNVLEYVNIVQKALRNIENLSSTYMKGYQTKTEYVELEYNTYVYICVEATSTLLYQFVDYMRRPTDQIMTIVLKNDTLRADLFYFEQLRKFNNVNDKMGIDYRKMLESLCEKGRNNFLGSEMVVGLAAISLVAMSIVPVTRECIYQIYHLREQLSKSLEMQAAFLEMNAACVNSNTAFTAEKKKKILEKQNKTKNKLLKLANTLKVNAVKSKEKGKKDIKESNKMLTINSIQNEVSDSPFEFV